MEAIETTENGATRRCTSSIFPRLGRNLGFHPLPAAHDCHEDALSPHWARSLAVPERSSTGAPALQLAVTPSWELADRLTNQNARS